MKPAEGGALKDDVSWRGTSPRAPSSGGNGRKLWRGQRLRGRTMALLEFAGAVLIGEERNLASAVLGFFSPMGHPVHNSLYLSGQKLSFRANVHAWWRYLVGCLCVVVC